MKWAQSTSTVPLPQNYRLCWEKFYPSQSSVMTMYINKWLFTYARIQIQSQRHAYIFINSASSHLMNKLRNNSVSSSAILWVVIKRKPLKHLLPNIRQVFSQWSWFYLFKTQNYIIINNFRGALQSFCVAKFLSSERFNWNVCLRYMLQYLQMQIRWCDKQTTC